MQRGAPLSSPGLTDYMRDVRLWPRDAAEVDHGG
jgi:hypothetical protein